MNPSACPYSQRWMIELPKPGVGRGRILELLDPRAGERVLELLGARRDGRALEELALRRIELPRAEKRDVALVDDAAVEQHAERHAPGVARRRGLGRVEVAVRVDPDDAAALAMRLHEPTERPEGDGMVAS